MPAKTAGIVSWNGCFIAQIHFEFEILCAPLVFSERLTNRILTAEVAETAQRRLNQVVFFISFSVDSWIAPVAAVRKHHTNESILNKNTLLDTNLSGHL